MFPHTYSSDQLSRPYPFLLALWSVCALARTFHDEQIESPLAANEKDCNKQRTCNWMESLCSHHMLERLSSTLMDMGISTIIDRSTFINHPSYKSHQRAARQTQRISWDWCEWRWMQRTHRHYLMLPFKSNVQCVCLCMWIRLASNHRIFIDSDLALTTSCTKTGLCALRDVKHISFEN